MEKDYNKDNIHEMTFHEVIEDARSGRTIRLIKHMRALSGLGLKDSKDLIETCRYSSGEYNTKKLTDLFKEYGVQRNKVTKEQFLKIIDKAIDSGHAMYCDDMLDAVEQLCANLRKAGGLKEIELRRQQFLDKL